MELFYSTKVVDIDVNKGTSEQHKILIKPVDPAAVASGQIPHNLIYVSTLGCVYNIQSTIESAKLGLDLTCFSASTKKKVCAMSNFPINISNFDTTAMRALTNDRTPIPNTPFIELKERLKPLIDKGQETINVALINGIGTGIGDSVIGIRALQLFHLELSKYFKTVTLDLFQTPFNANANKRKLYDQEKIVNANEILPTTLEKLLQYDCVADFSSMVLRENFDKVPMIDFFLENLSINPESVPTEQKRNFVKVNERIKINEEIKFVALKQSGKKILMIHPAASVGTRSMPKEVLHNLINEVLAKTDYNIILTSPGAMPEIKNNRVFDFSNASSNIDDFVYVISKVDSIITVDTCVYHIADSFSKPTVAIFTTIDPNLRTVYYPTVQSMVLKPNNKLWGLHGSMDAKDLQYTHSLWKNLDTNQVLASLDLAIAQTQIKSKIIECPVCKQTNEYVATDKYMSYSLVTCSKCESEFADPRIPEDYNKAYEEQESYIRYVKERPRDETINGFMSLWRMEAVKNFLTNMSERGTFLDVGCSNGFCVGFAEDLGFDAYGIDASKIAVGFAEDYLKLKGKAYVCEDLSALPEEMPEQYDVITSFELVEHLPDPNLFAKQVYDRLKPGGIWIFSTPNRNRMQFAMGVKNTGKHRGHDTGDYPAEHLTRFKAKGHKTLIENNNLKMIHQCTTRVAASTISDAFGFFPALSVTDDSTGKVLNLNPQALNQAVYSYFQNMTNCIQGYGNFLTSFAQKPK